MTGYIQVIDTYDSLKGATAVLKALRAQVGFTKGRVYFDASAARSKRYVCQAFFDPKDQLAHLGLVSEPRYETADAQQ
jgi:hypothetical protein